MKKSRNNSATAPRGFSRRIRKLRAGVSQGDFAKAIGVEQPAVSAFERGKYEPSPEVYLRLGMLATAKDRKWFWAKAESAVEKLLPIAVEILRERGAPPTASETTYRVPPMREFLGEREAPDLLFSSSVVPNLATTKYVRITDPVMKPMFATGDVLIVDTSETDPKNLEGECVALFKPSNRLVSEERKRDTGESSEFIDAHRFDPLHNGVFAGWLSRRPIEGLSVVVDGASQSPSIETVVATGPIRMGAPVTVSLDVFQGNRVLHRSNTRVLGLVTGWFRPHEDSNRKGKVKK